MTIESVDLRRSARGRQLRGVVPGLGHAGSPWAGRPAGGDTPVPGPTRAAVDAWLAHAKSDVILASTAVTSDAAIALPRRIDFDNLRRGVRYRVLFPDRVRTIPALANHLGRLALAGAEVRTATKVPMDALVVDGSLAIVPKGAPDEQPCGLAMFALPSVVGTSMELFERVWSTCVPLTGSEVPSGAELDPRERELLALLFEGYTDVVAGARLGISVRTVRRMVSEMMNRLGARSRFQAGAKAADRGWLEERAG